MVTEKQIMLIRPNVWNSEPLSAWPATSVYREQTQFLLLSELSQTKHSKLVVRVLRAPGIWLCLGLFPPEIGMKLAIGATSPRSPSQKTKKVKTRNEVNLTTENYGVLSASNAVESKVRGDCQSARFWAPAFCCSTPHRYTAISCSEFDSRPRRRAICTSAARALSSSTGSTRATTAAR